MGRVALAGALLIAATAAHALSTDRNQQMFVDSDHALLQQGTDEKPGVNVLTGNVQIVQGSMKAHGDEATIYQHASNAKDAQGNDISNKIQRIVLVAKKTQAHMEQLQDNDGGLITANADKIDYNADTDITDMTGNVVVVQECRGTFRGTHMTYNRMTGEIESGDNTPVNRVHMVMEPGSNTKAATPGATPVCTPTKSAAAPAASTAKPAPAAPAPAQPADKKPSKKTKKPAATDAKPAASGTP